MIGIVVIAASAGGHDPLFRIITALPGPCTAAVFVVMHIGPHPSILPELLASRGKLPVMFPQMKNPAAATFAMRIRREHDPS